MCDLKGNAFVSKFSFLRFWVLAGNELLLIYIEKCVLVRGKESKKGTFNIEVQKQIY